MFKFYKLLRSPHLRLADLGCMFGVLRGEEEVEVRSGARLLGRGQERVLAPRLLQLSVSGTESMYKS